MCLSRKIAAIGFRFHANFQEVINILNQLKILNNDRGERIAKWNVMKALDALECIRYDLEKALKKASK